MEQTVSNALGVHCYAQGGVVHKCVLRICQSLPATADAAAVWAAVSRLPYGSRQVLQRARANGSAAVEADYESSTSSNSSSSDAALEGGGQHRSSDGAAGGGHHDTATQSKLGALRQQMDAFYERRVDGTMHTLHAAADARLERKALHIKAPALHVSRAREALSREMSALRESLRGKWEPFWEAARVAVKAHRDHGEQLSGGHELHAWRKTLRRVVGAERRNALAQIHQHVDRQAPQWQAVARSHVDRAVGILARLPRT